MLRNLTQPLNKKSYWRKIAFDSIFVLSIFFYAFSASSYFNFSDNYFAWARQYEQSLDIDELPVALLASLIALLWFAQRRINESSVLMTKNHALLQRVIEVQEAERKRIAQDLHDELGQYLNAIKVQATSLLVDNTSSSDTLSTAKRMVSTADHAYQSARHMMQSLRPVALDELGLSAALEHLVDTWRPHNTKNAVSMLHTKNITKKIQPQSPTHYTINIENNIDGFNEQMNIALFRIVQEALTNIAKHAQAKQVVVHIKNTTAELILEIRDDGIGFDLNKKTNGYGLLGMMERSDALGGKFNIQSEAHVGTKITLVIHTRPKLNSSK